MRLFKVQRGLECDRIFCVITALVSSDMRAFSSLCCGVFPSIAMLVA
jgi:hypothetical protein